MARDWKASEKNKIVGDNDCYYFGINIWKILKLQASELILLGMAGMATCFLILMGCHIVVPT